MTISALSSGNERKIRITRLFMSKANDNPRKPDLKEADYVHWGPEYDECKITAGGTGHGMESGMRSRRKLELLKNL